jgi:predicted  nucleic acid-binding Zn-ribbon protein
MLVGNWVQFATLLLAIIAFAMHVEGRLARIEQDMADQKEQRQELVQQMDRIETFVYQRTP